MKYLLIFLGIPHVFCNVELTIKYLKEIESSQNLHSIFILKINNSKYSDEILNSLSLPKVILHDGLKMNYLNFPTSNVVRSLKHYFHSEYMAIIFAENFEKDNIRKELFKDIAWYGRDNIFFVISDKTYENAGEVLNQFRTNSFLNVIYLCVENFYNSRTFQLFPYFKYISHLNFEKEVIGNIQHYQMKAICNSHTPFSYCLLKNNQIKGIGRIYHLVTNFIKFINGTVIFKVELKNEYSSPKLLKYIDI